MNKPSILLIYTGGTIGMIKDPSTGLLKPFNFNHLFDEIPELRKFEIEIETYAFEQPIDSSNMNLPIWQKLADLIRLNYHRYDGFVILHGSDTMAYTASALSFMLENLGKAVIFTGSQLPIGTIRTDGKENLITAIEIAAAYEMGKPIVPEVAIYFEYDLYRANRTKKVSTENFEAFQSPNYPKLAEAGVKLKYNRFAIRHAPQEQELIVHTQLCTQLGFLKLFPGVSETFVRNSLNIEGIKAIILETFGAGNAPTFPWFTTLLKEAVDNNLIILNVSQCISGAVDQSIYETGSHMQEIGVISGRDMTNEAAITKLMYLLGNESLSKSETIKYLNENLRGELTE